MAEEDATFRRWREGAVDAIGQPAAPLALLIVSVLRYLGRGWTLDNLSENTGNQQGSYPCFLTLVLLCGSHVLFNKL